MHQGPRDSRQCRGPQRPCLRAHPAEVCRKVVGRECQLRNNAEAAAATALERPEKIRIGAGVSDEYLAVCGNNLGLQQARRSQAVVLREAPEATALD